METGPSVSTPLPDGVAPAARLGRLIDGDPELVRQFDERLTRIAEHVDQSHAAPGVTAESARMIALVRGGRAAEVPGVLTINDDLVDPIAKDVQGAILLALCRTIEIDLLQAIGDDAPAPLSPNTNGVLG